MSSRQTIFQLAMLVAVVGVTGCSSFLNIGEADRACDSMKTPGVTCMSAREVYRSTENTDRAKITHTSDGKAVNRDSADEQGNDDISTENVGETKRSSAAVVPYVDKPIPLRSQPKVLRIWVAPWEDADGDLHIPGVMYTEIEPRKWNLGDGLVRKVGSVVSPLQSSVDSGQTLLTINQNVIDKAPSAKEKTGTNIGSPGGAQGFQSGSTGSRTGTQFKPVGAPVVGGN